MFKYSPPRYLFRRHTLLRNVKRGDKFLEIGAGNLMLSRDLLRYFNSGTCLDFAKGVKDIHRNLPETEKNRLEIIIGDFFGQKFSNQFDCVIACEVMEHIKDDSRFVKKCHSSLKKSGQLVISVPARQKYWTIHDEIVGHFRRYEKRELIEMVEALGFKDVRVLSYGYPFVNILWLLRTMLARSQAKKKSSWSKEKQTKESGIGQIPNSISILGFIANKYVFFVPNLIASLFNRYDLSEGYIILAIKK